MVAIIMVRLAAPTNSRKNVSWGVFMVVITLLNT
jgi:hypothetical protein